MKHIIEHVERVKDEMYTTLVVRSGHLQERYYPSYPPPDYTIVRANLTPEEIEFCRTVGIV